MSTLTRYTSLWTITKGASVIRAAATPRPLVYTFDGFTYQAAPLLQSKFDEQLDIKQANEMELVISLTDVGVTEQDLYAGKWDRARLLVQFIDYENLAAAPVRKWRGVFAKTGVVNERLAKGEFHSLSSLFRNSIGRVYQKNCRVTEYGAGRCLRNLTTSGDTHTGTVTAVSDNGQFELSVVQANAYFTHGTILFTSGPNVGLPKRVIKDQTGAGVILHDEFPYTVAVGNAFTAVRGCDRTLVTCIDRGQAKNYDGEWEIPGRNRLAKKFPD